MQELNEYKEQLFSSLTHNLKTPLNSILPILEFHESNLDPEVYKKQIPLLKSNA